MYSSSASILKFIKKDSLGLLTIKNLLKHEHSKLSGQPNHGTNYIQTYQYHMHQPKKHLLQLYEKIIALHASKYMTSDFKNTSAKPPESGNESNPSLKTESKPPGTDSSLSATARFKEAVIKAAIPRKTEQIKEEKGYLSRERNFLTALRAMSEFLLTPADLEGLRKTKRRSPFENEPPITVYWRRDVEAKALKVWGSAEVLEMEKSKRDKEIKEYQEHLFNLKRTLRAYQKEKRTREEEGETEESQDPIRSRTKSPSFDASAKVVWTAVVINGANFVMKLGAWAMTGSHCLFAEALHSLADFTNQLILAYGIHKSNQEANLDHPYGYTTMRYVSSLISGAMIFCVGAGLSVQHGISGLIHPSEVMPLYWAFFILGGSLITEGGTLVMAIDAIRKGARQENVSFINYVFRGDDPSTNVVLMEDMAAVLGVGIAFTCMGLTSITGSHIPDALGSCIIGGLLAGVSGFIIYTNSAALAGRSIPQQDIQALNLALESDVMIRAIHDVKGIDMGSGFARYKAEVDFDGRELTRQYLEKHDIETLFMEMNNLNSVEAAEAFLLKHGENIVDGLGAEVDRIEKSLKKENPKIRHIDLEIL